MLASSTEPVQRLTAGFSGRLCTPSFTDRPGSVHDRRSRQLSSAVGRQGESRATASSSTLESVDVVEPVHVEDTLPESWQAVELEDAAIEEELRKLRPQQAQLARQLARQPESVQRMRSRVLRRRRPTARRSRPETAEKTSLENGYAPKLSAKEQEQLCGLLRVRFTLLHLHTLRAQLLLRYRRITLTIF